MPLNVRSSVTYYIPCITKLVTGISNVLLVTEKLTNKKVSKANKIRMLIQYSITYHYDLISISTRDANQKNSPYMSLTTPLREITS